MTDPAQVPSLPKPRKYSSELFCCRSPFEHTKPTLHPQTAVVVGPGKEEIYTDHLNRVKVQFLWDRQNDGDERASCWVRVSYPNAGQAGVEPMCHASVKKSSKPSSMAMQTGQ